MCLRVWALAVLFILPLAHPGTGRSMLAAATPEILIDRISPFGQSPGVIQGRVSGAGGGGERMAALIFVTGMGWFSKPTCAEPTSAIGSDGRFSITFTTGGVDAFAERIALLVMPPGSAVSCVTNGRSIPPGMERQAAARLVVPRPNPNQRRLTFGGEEWLVKSVPAAVGPGPNWFSSSDQAVFPDLQGRLHLKIYREAGRWVCAEVYSKRPMGYGTYTVVLDTPPHTDRNAVLGFYLWSEAAGEMEIDQLEVGMFGRVESDNAQYVVQPWDVEGNLQRHFLPAGATTHRMTYLPDGLTFESFSGNRATEENRITKWTYAGTPPAAGSPNVNYRMNFWLFEGRAPEEGGELEAVISDFRYVPAEGVTAPPSIRAAVNSANFGPSPAAGGLGTILGTGLASGQAVADTLPLPTRLLDVQVSVAGVPAPLLYAAPTQINFQVPYEVAPQTGDVVVYRGGDPVASAAVQVRNVAPEVFRFEDGRCILQHQDGTLNSPSNSADSGSVLRAWLTGIGPVEPAVQTGWAAPLSSTSRATLPATARFGTTAAQLQSYGLVPGLVGVGQAGLVVPALARGDYDLVFAAGAATSAPCRVSAGRDAPAPTISGCQPRTGPSSGGTVVTISGTGFQTGASVFFGQTAAGNVIFSGATALQATTPAGTGTVAVTVRNPDGKSASLAGGFTYQALPPRISARLEGCRVRGTVTGLDNPAAYRLVVYAATNQYWIQPCDTERTQSIQANGDFGPIDSHSGDIYLLVVRNGYVPPAATGSLPAVDGRDVFASSGRVGTLGNCDVARCPAH